MSHQPTQRMNQFCRIVLLVVTLASTLTAQGGNLKVGVSKTDITPPIGGGTTGYSSAPPTDGVHDPVEARVLVFQSDEITVALVSWDLCIFNSPWLHERKNEMGVDILLLANTHTHAGPNMRQESFPTPEAPWRRTVEERTLEAIKQAQSSLFDASVVAGIGELPIGYNRLKRHKGGYAMTHFENPERIPYGPIDPTINVLRITDVSGDAQVVLVNTACHPVVLGPRNRKISAGFPGVMRRRIESALGPETMAVFLQGGAGDVNPLIMARDREDRRKDFERVETLGNLVAGEALKVIESMPPESTKVANIKASSSVMTFAHRFEADQILQLGTASILLNNEIGLVTMPGEPFHKFQVDLRQVSELPYTFFLGYTCNDGYRWPSYLPDLQSAAYGGYGASDTTRAEVGAGERLLHRGIAQLYQLQGRLRNQPIRHLAP